jgi:hypothetical protein
MARELAEKEKEYQTLIAENRVLEQELIPKRKQNEILKKDVQDTKVRVRAKEETVGKEAENLSALMRKNQRLNSENIKLEQRLDTELAARGLSRVDYGRVYGMEKQVTQLGNERVRLKREHEELKAKWNQSAQQRETVARELLLCQEESKSLREIHQKSMEIKERLKNELEMKEKKREARSLAGRLKRRLEDLQHENLGRFPPFLFVSVCFILSTFFFFF